MKSCQLIDLVNLGNSRALQTWRSVERRLSPLTIAVDRALPVRLVQERKRLSNMLKKIIRGRMGSVEGEAGAKRQGAGECTNEEPERPVLKVGDIVRVKPAEEIRRTLNRSGMNGGLHFMPVQYLHCGRTYRILKRVNTFLDERDFRMKRLRNVVILEGVYCDGSPLEPEPCDRMCFLFWKDIWLEKVPSDGERPIAATG